MTRGHGIDQRAIRHVDGGIADRQQKICPECPGNFDARTGFRHGKREYANNADGHCHPQLPRAKASPAALRAVGDNAHYRVGDGVENAQGHKQRAHQRGSQPKNIGVKEGQKIHDQAGNNRAARVA